MLCSHLGKNSVFNRDLNGGCIFRLLSAPVDTARINASRLADDLVKQSDRQSADATCARSAN